MQSINLTPLFQALIALAASVITVYLVPWIRARTDAEQRERIEAAVHVAVYAAEKLYGAGHGAEKLAYAEAWLRERGVELDMATLNAQINAAIREMDLMDVGEIETDPDD